MTKIEQSSNSPKLESKIPNSQSEALRNSKENLAKEKMFSSCINAVNPSGESAGRAMELLKILDFFDKQKLTKFEFSFKSRKGKANNEIRVLNMDANAYSCRSSKFFLRRVRLFEKILEKRCRNKNYLKVISALNSIANTPMDLYFGFDVKDKEYVFAFWLIFGGVKRGDEVSFWPYDFEAIINDTLDKIGLKKHKLLKKEILNLGFDIGKDFLRYKVYYLCREKVMQGSVFTDLMKEINANISDFKYFYFFSEMYNEEGELAKEKLFIEFLEDIKNNGEKKIKAILECIAKISGIEFNAQELRSRLEKYGGRTSLISFEPNGALTFYIRPD